MGQKFGKAQPLDSAHPLVNLDTASVNSLWEAFNDVAEGFGINIEEFTEITMVLQRALGNASKHDILKISEGIFLTLDTDENMLVDALETLCTLCLLSGMTPVEKSNFLFTCYDFDESGEITLDEMTLLLKSAVTGLTKVSGLVAPEEYSLEQLAQDAFKRGGKSYDVRLTREEFVEYVLQNPEITSWMNFYDDLLGRKSLGEDSKKEEGGPPP